MSVDGIKTIAGCQRKHEEKRKHKTNKRHTSNEIFLSRNHLKILSETYLSQKNKTRIFFREDLIPKIKKYTSTLQANKQL